jgi:hypothetical protein
VPTIVHHAPTIRRVSTYRNAPRAACTLVSDAFKHSTERPVKAAPGRPIPPRTAFDRPTSGLVRSRTAIVRGEIMSETDHGRWLTYAEAGQLLGVSARPFVCSPSGAAGRVVRRMRTATERVC